MNLYKIKDWAKHFEVAQSRKASKLTWVAVPNKHDGKTYRRLIHREDGAQVYGVWHILLQVASKGEPRGQLRDAEGPLTVHDIELKTGVQAKVISHALSVLSSQEIGWIEVEEILPVDSQSAPIALPPQTNKTNKTNKTTSVPLDFEPEAEQRWSIAAALLRSTSLTKDVICMYLHQTRKHCRKLGLKNPGPEFFERLVAYGYAAAEKVAMGELTGGAGPWLISCATRGRFSPPDELWKRAASELRKEENKNTPLLDMSDIDGIGGDA